MSDPAVKLHAIAERINQLAKRSLRIANVRHHFAHVVEACKNVPNEKGKDIMRAMNLQALSNYRGENNRDIWMRASNDFATAVNDDAFYPNSQDVINGPSVFISKGVFDSIMLPLPDDDRYMGAVRGDEIRLQPREQHNGNITHDAFLNDCPVNWERFRESDQFLSDIIDPSQALDPVNVEIWDKHFGASQYQEMYFSFIEILDDIKNLHDAGADKNAAVKTVSPKTNQLTPQYMMARFDELKRLKENQPTSDGWHPGLIEQITGSIVQPVHAGADLVEDIVTLPGRAFAQFFYGAGGRRTNQFTDNHDDLTDQYKRVINQLQHAVEWTVQAELSSCQADNHRGSAWPQVSAPS